ncbi:hypothetical protein E0H82_01995 [Acinetobacter sp. ANC 4910]|nr:hypothetical protein E0H82_01995 [Acinetobacter sp. ANC 4910]
MQAFYSAIGAVLLGIMLTFTWSMYINSSTNSVMIILMTTIISAIADFLFPNFIQHGFKLFWNFFR